MELAPRFWRSINLEADFGQPGMLDGYVVSPLVRDVAQRVCRELSSDTAERAWSLVGPYGTGKSSFLNFLCMLLAGGVHRKQAMKVMAQAWPSDARVLSATLEGSSGPLIPVLITGSRMPMGQAILQGLQRAVKRLWPDGGVAVGSSITKALKAYESGQRLEDNALADLALGLAGAVHADAELAGSGVFLVVDEMGKLLEFAAQHPEQSDVYLLQALAEKSARLSEGRLGLLTVLHQAFDNYAHRLSQTDRLEWEKVAGRFGLIPFQETTRHQLSLIARALKTAPGWQTLVPTRRDIATQVAKEFGRDQRAIEADLMDCSPLNPTTALCLGPLFRLGLGQNERSLFSFLISREPQGFQEYLQGVREGSVSRQFGLDDLFDYLMANSNVRLGGSSHRIWSATEEALSRLPKSATKLDERLLKTIALLTLVGEQANLRAKKDVLSWALQADPDETVQALRRLQRSSILVYRKFKASYQIWDGSDLDVEALIQKGRERVADEGKFAEKLQQVNQPYPIIASRLYHDTGTLRFFSPQYVGAEQAKSRKKWPSSTEGDGDLYIIIPDKLKELDGLQATVAAFKPRSKDRPRVFVIPPNLPRILDLLQEFFGIVYAQENTPELADDPIARRELDERKLISQAILSEAIDEGYGISRSENTVVWLYNQTEWRVEGRVSAVATAIFKDVYRHAPEIHNELINRQRVSSAAAAARRTLMERMCSHAHDEQLGMTGFPAEVSLYLSVLKMPGLHQKDAKGRWRLVPPTTRHMKPLWTYLRKSVFGSKRGQRQLVSGILTQMSVPPYGVREGVAPILLLAYYLLNKDALFFYEDGSFVPSLEESSIQRLLSRPESFELQLIAEDDELAQFTKILRDTLSINRPRGDVDIFYIVRVLLRQIRRLSLYASKTQSLSKQAIHVRSAIKAARDPMDLILEKLPTAVGAKPFRNRKVESEEYEAFARHLNQALFELQHADDVLGERISQTLLELFGNAGSRNIFCKEIHNRAARLEGVGDISAQVRRFVDLTSTMDPEDVSSQETWLQGVGTAVIGKPPSAWSDTDVTQFPHKAMRLAQNFMATEQLVLERKQHSAAITHMIRVSILDTEGNDQSGVAVLREEDSKKVRDFRKQVAALAKSHKITNREMAYAVIAQMMDALQEAEKGTS